MAEIESKANVSDEQEAHVSEAFIEACRARSQLYQEQAHKDKEKVSKLRENMKDVSEETAIYKAELVAEAALSSGGAVATDSSIATSLPEAPKV